MGKTFTVYQLWRFGAVSEPLETWSARLGKRHAHLACIEILCIWSGSSSAQKNVSLRKHAYLQESPRIRYE